MRREENKTEWHQNGNHKKEDLGEDPEKMDWCGKRSKNPRS